MSGIEEIAQKFIDFYYATFRTDRSNLRLLYRDPSMLSFEGSCFQGSNAITEKLQSLPFKSIQHQISSMDCQPSVLPNSLIVCVTGHLLADGEKIPLPFTETFHLINENGSFWIHNDVFRLHLQ